MTEQHLHNFDRDLAGRLARALAADSDELLSVMQDSTIDVLSAALRNPLLEEKHLIALLQRKGLPAELFRMLHEHRCLASSYKTVFRIACHPETPPHISLAMLERIHLFDLLKICIAPQAHADLRAAAERTIIRRLPAEPLGNRISLGRRGTSAIVEALVREGDYPVVEACLENPRLKEGCLYQFIQSYKATPEVISLVGRSNRWKGRPGIQLAMLKNPRTPAVWYTLFLPGLSTPLLKELSGIKRLSAEAQAMIRAALKKRSC